MQNQKVLTVLQKELLLSSRKKYSTKDKITKQKAVADKKIFIETLASTAETAASRGKLSTVSKITKQLSGKLKKLQ